MPIIPRNRPGQDQNLSEEKHMQLLKRRQRKKRDLVIDVLFERWADLQVLAIFSPGALQDSLVIVSRV